MTKQFIRIAVLVCLLVLVNSSSCDRDDFRFPYVPVNIYAGIYTDLAALGPGGFGFYYPDAGLNGLIIYRTFDNQYLVFDRTCTHETELNCATVQDPENTFLALCPCCESQFLPDEAGCLIIRGPARHPLVQYKAIIEGSNLHIFN
jgi:Rieske Fe-S protein